MSVQVLLEEKIDNFHRHLKLRGKWLGCYYKPEASYCDILTKFFNSWDDEK